MKQLMDAIAPIPGLRSRAQDDQKNVPHYGNNNPYTDTIARAVTSHFAGRAVQKPRGGMFIPGIYSIRPTYPCAVCAPHRTAESVAPIAEACSPCHGPVQYGPTQLLSVASLTIC